MQWQRGTEGHANPQAQQTSQINTPCNGNRKKLT